MVDIGRDDGAALGDLVAHEFGRDEGRDLSAEALALRDLSLGVFQHFLTAEIFALGDVDHLLGDDAGTGELILGDGLAIGFAVRVGAVRVWGDAAGRVEIDGLEGAVTRREGAGQMLAGGAAIVFRAHIAAFIFLNAAAFEHPVGAVAGKALLDIDTDRRVGIWAGRVIDRHRFFIRGGVQVNQAARHRQGRVGLWMGIDLAAGRQRAGGDSGGLEVRLAGGLVHVGSLQMV